MKRWIAFILLPACMLMGCRKEAEPEDPLADWLQTAKLGAEETPEELYAAALEEGMLVIYSTSTRMFDVVKSFEAQYPGLTAKVEHLRERDLYDKLDENYANRRFVCDLICSADGRGVMAGQYLKQNIAVKYTPHDIARKIIPGYDEDVLSIMGEASILSYNENFYSEPPVNNWWELTEEKWRGMVYMPNPARSTTTLAFFNMIIQNSEVMAKAYEDLYGEPLALSDGESAGREFVRRLIVNDAHIVNSSDETAEAIGAPGSKSPSIGIMVSSKTRLRALGYEMVNHYGMEPFVGVYTPNSIMMAGGSKNINAAKLFVRWLLGEADGQGEGYKPYLQSGAWSVRTDVQDNTGIDVSTLNLWKLDKLYLYENYEASLRFWEGLLGER